MRQPEPGYRGYDRLFAEIDSGRIKIPVFQREFVWTDVQTAALLDSIVKGFPIGTFILWKTREELRHIKDIGNVELPDIPKGDSAYYVLDGQQRITSLYAVRKGIRISKEGREIDYRGISVNLACDPDWDEEIVTVEPPDDAPCISVHKLLNGTLKELSDQYGEHLDTIDMYRSRLSGYNFSVIEIAECPIDVACEVFTRINTGGTKLTLFEIMVAKTYDQHRHFDLSREYETLVDSEGMEKDLEDAGFETIAEATVLQCISAHLCERVRRKDILRLDKYEFIDSWPLVKDGMFFAVDYVRTQLRIPVSRLLPYDALLVPLTYFFIRNDLRMPSPVQNKLLIQYFWWASLSYRFSSGVEGKLAQDLQRMDMILEERPPSYHGEEVGMKLEHLIGHWFSAGDAISKAILCLYAYFEPKSFASNSLVKLDNSWLKVASSKNFHHFFPKSYLRTRGFTDLEANSILNITLVDDYLNKRKIRARAQSDYMREFQEKNDELDSTLRTHLIDDAEDYGIWSDDYQAFIDSRGDRVVTEIRKRLYPELT